MTNAAGTLRLFLLSEVAMFVLASLLHRGILARGFAHAQAATAESAIAMVLAIGLALAVHRPSVARAAALWSQTFALLGVCVGIGMILIGVGPRSPLDYGIHAVMLVTLVSGIATVRRQFAGA